MTGGASGELAFSGAPCSVRERGAFPASVLTNLPQYWNDVWPAETSWTSMKQV